MSSHGRHLARGALQPGAVEVVPVALGVHRHAVLARGAGGGRRRLVVVRLARAPVGVVQRGAVGPLELCIYEQGLLL